MGDNEHERGWPEPSLTMLWAQCSQSEDALLPAHPLMFPHKANSGDVQEDQGGRQGNYLPQKKWALLVSVLTRAYAGRSLGSAVMVTS